MQQLRVPAGSEIFLGAPAVLMEPEIVAALGGLVDDIPEVIEAHLPQAFVPGTMSTPTQVLVIVTEKGDRHLALSKLGPGLGRILPDGRPIEVWPLSPGDQLLPAVRGANCLSGDARDDVGSWVARVDSGFAAEARGCLPPRTQVRLAHARTPWRPLTPSGVHSASGCWRMRRRHRAGEVGARGRGRHDCAGVVEAS